MKSNIRSLALGVKKGEKSSNLRGFCYALSFMLLLLAGCGGVLLLAGCSSSSSGCDSCDVTGPGNDADGDGIRNTVDNCPLVANPLQEDADLDGTGDVCENDIDGDGILDGADNCPFIANPLQEDADSDGTGDLCEGAPLDTDMDGILDGVDNCQFIANPLQTDTDLDGIGDACESLPNLSPAPVNLGSSGNYVILAKSGITATAMAPNSITGNLGCSPATAAAITGFGLIMDSSNTFATSSLVIGNIYAANYAAPTPGNLTVDVLAMEAAYVDAAGRAPDYTELGGGNIGGLNLAPATYKWSTGVSIPTNVTLTGSPTDVWIFEIAGNLTVSSAAQVVLAGGAVPENIFWQVAGIATLGTTSQFNGIILTGPGTAAVVMNNGAILNGRALSQKNVTMINNTVTEAP